MVTTEEFEENIKKEEEYRKDKEEQTNEVAEIIDEIIDGISVRGRRSTLVRTISTIVR